MCGCWATVTSQNLGEDVPVELQKGLNLELLAGDGVRSPAHLGTLKRDINSEEDYLACESLHPFRESLLFSHESLNLSYEFLHLIDESLLVSRQPLHLTHESLLVSRESLILIDECLNFTSESLE